MNHFELFSIPIGFDINLADLMTRFRELQSRYHPDKFAGDCEQSQGLALQKASLINDAYAILMDPIRRCEHLLELSGYELTGELKVVQDVDFLMQQMQFHETLEAINATGDFESEIDKMAQVIISSQQSLEVDFISSFQNQDLESAADAVRKMTFFARLKQQLRRIEDKLLEL